MRFELIDHILELTDERIIAVKQVTNAEEYLQDHFPTFPVLPGVLMLETMVQAARHLLTHRDPALARHVLASTRAFKYGVMVRPGQTLRVEIKLTRAEPDHIYTFKGTGTVLATDGDPTGNPTGAVGGRFTLRPLNLPTTQSS